MRKITVFTGTRAEYGLLFWLLKDIQACDQLKLQLLVSCMHLSPEFGLTYRQIEKDGFEIDEKVEMLLSSDTAVGIAKSMGVGTLGFADSLARLNPDVLVILGDRFESLALAQCALVMKIPVLHIHGGEVTEGAYDDAIRHAISKLSLQHCTTTEEYRQRVIQLGEHPERVHNVGAIGLDHLNRMDMLSKQQLSQSLDFILKGDFFVVTYHPVTLGKEQPESAFGALLEALDEFPEHQVIITYPNADDGGRRIMPMIEAYANQHQGRVLAIPSLGQIRYLSALKYATAVIGNSSSGIIEVPAFDVPTVNIGARQLGRLACELVLHCQPTRADIIAAINTAVNRDFIEPGQTITNPYGQGDASGQIIEILKVMELDCMKSFYDVEFT